MLIRWVRAVFFALAVLVISSSSFGQVFISVGFGPPPIPLYEQPLCPGDGYIWTPGYWAWGDDDQDYYWVPGTWVLAPEIGFLWTPPYWAWLDGRFAFYDGYWGPEVGFYGGIDYGFGYFGEGFDGGRWENGRFFYNRSVMHVDVNVVHNVYNTTVVDRGNGRRISYNGGPGGIDRRPTPREEAASHQRHLPPAPAQVQHMQAARRMLDLRASANHGKPPVAATARPAAFTGREVVPAREAGGPYHPPERGTSRNATSGRPATPVHPRDLSPIERPATSAGNSKADRKYQQEQEKLFQKQQSERQKLQQQQDREHEKLARQNANEARRQQTEQRHQQETQQLQQRHVEQRQRMQQRAAPPAPRPESRPPRR